jgi:MarR family transcriptional regulator, organic hydroperoxide resistance regulator
MPDLINWTLPRLLSTAARLVEHAWNEHLAALNLTHAGFFALEVLKAEGAMSQVQLANRLRVQGQTIGKTLARLEAHGHVVRNRSQADQRSQLINISEQGALALEQASRLEQLLDSDDGQNTLNERLAVIIRRLGNSRFNINAPGIH